MKVIDAHKRLESQTSSGGLRCLDLILLARLQHFMGLSCRTLGIHSVLGCGVSAGMSLIYGSVNQRSRKFPQTPAAKA